MRLDLKFDIESLLVRAAPFDESSPSSSMVSCWPRRELVFREYGRDGGPGVRGFWMPTVRGGAGLANLGGAPMALFENCDGVTLPLRPGVGGARFDVLRSGDSGRETDGRLGRAPGPTDCENLFLETEGVFGLKFGFSVVERLKLLPAYEGVVGEGGKSSEVPDERLSAR